MFKALKTRRGKQVLTWMGALTAAVVLGVAGTTVVIGQTEDDDGASSSGGSVGAAVVVSGTGQDSFCGTTAAFTDNVAVNPPSGGAGTGAVIATVTLRKNCQGIITGTFTGQAEINNNLGDLRVRAVAQSCTNIGSTPCSTGLLPLIAAPGETAFLDDNDVDNPASFGYSFLFTNLAPGNYVINLVARNDAGPADDPIQDRVLIVNATGPQTP